MQAAVQYQDGLQVRWLLCPLAGLSWKQEMLLVHLYFGTSPTLWLCAIADRSVPVIATATSTCPS